MRKEVTAKKKRKRPPGTIPVRWFFNFFLVAVVAIPMLVTGLVAIDRATTTAVSEVRRGNQLAATSVAGGLGEYIEGERKLLQAIGEATVQMRDADAHEAVLDSFLLKNTHIARAAVFDASGKRVAGASDLESALGRTLTARRASIEAKPRHSGALSLGHVVFWAEPLIVAGDFAGAIVAEIELVGIWEPINAIRVGQTGFVRLVASDGALLAHGNSSERRKVYSATEQATDPALLAAAQSGRLYPVADADPLIVTSAPVPAIGGVVVIEQSSAEALGAVAQMKVWLYGLFAAAVLIALVVGMVLSRRLVAPLESLSDHVDVLAAGDLAVRIDQGSLTGLAEVRGLADAVNDMAGRLDDLQREKLGQERLNTFARVAAGLAHDIRHPIESVRAACYERLNNPEDPMTEEMFRDVVNVDLPRLKKFVDDLEGLARTGSLAVDREEHDALAIALEAVDEIKIAPKWGRIVEFHASGEIDADVAVDKSLVKRALYNLMHNAGEACMTNGLRRAGGKVELRVELSPGEMVAFNVIDTGPGIEKSRVADLMTSDFKSTKRSTGVGLGLGVARQVAESHGGRLAIESTVGVGSTFSILLPRAGEMAGKPSGGVGNEVQ